MCRLFGVELPIQEYEVTRSVEAILTALALIGVLQDPTTPGLNDSQLVLSADRAEEEPNEL